MRISPIVLLLFAALGCGSATQPTKPSAESGGDQAQQQQAAKPIKVVPNSPKTKVAIEAAIRKTAGKPTGELTNEDLAKVTGLDVLLDIRSENITDLTPLAGLTNLVELQIGKNQITDLKPLAGLTKLEQMAIGGNQITDLTPLADLTKLVVLGLDDNQITDLTPLARLKELKTLGLDRNQITNLTPLAGLTKLEWLRIAGNPNLTQAEIDKLQKALPKCKITHPF
jgi:Leucine-rich repeat (LRR) protein